MIFGQLLKNVLDKNQSVWIPTIGLLGYDKATSKLNLDVYGSGNDTDLVSLISEIKQVSQGEAKGILIQEVEAIKSAIRNEGKYAIDGLGDISMVNGSYQFEAKKALFPTNFFGTSNFNPAAFQNNAPKQENVFENTFIKVESKKVQETPKAEIIEQPVIKVEQIQEIEEAPKDLFEAAKSKQIQKIEIEQPKEEIVEKIVHPVIEPEPINESSEEKVEETIEPAKNWIEEKQVEDDIEEVILEDDNIEEENTPIVEEPKLIIDEPRRNIGRAAYDEGFYEYDLSASDSDNKKWKLVASAVLGLLALSFLIPWFWASMNGNKFLGLNPLWETNKEVKKIEKPHIAVKIDTAAAAVDSAQLIAKAKADSIADPILAATQSTADHTNTTNTDKKAASQIAATTSLKTTSSVTTQKTTNTSPKTPTLAINTSKKTAAVAAEKPKKSEVSSPKEAASIAVSNTTKDTMARLAKKVDVKVIGKPYATANYTKGNYYLSFGKFKVPTAAAKLRTDMKKKAGVETDIILVDGMYRVVIPYLSKDKAESASKDYVSTTLFE